MEIKLVDVGGVTKTSGVTSHVLSTGCATWAGRKHTGAVALKRVLALTNSADALEQAKVDAFMLTWTGQEHPAFADGNPCMTLTDVPSYLAMPEQGMPVGTSTVCGDQLKALIAGMSAKDDGHHARGETDSNLHYFKNTIAFHSCAPEMYSWSPGSTAIQFDIDLEVVEDNEVYKIAGGRVYNIENKDCDGGGAVTAKSRA
jgi:hypothetical protein